MKRLSGEMFDSVIKPEDTFNHTVLEVWEKVRGSENSEQGEPWN